MAEFVGPTGLTKYKRALRFSHLSEEKKKSTMYCQMFDLRSWNVGQIFYFNYWFYGLRLDTWQWTMNMVFFFLFQIGRFQSSLVFGRANWPHQLYHVSYFKKAIKMLYSECSRRSDSPSFVWHCMWAFLVFKKKCLCSHWEVFSRDALLIFFK